MQILLKVVYDNSDHSSIVDDYLAQFSARILNEDVSVEFPPSEGEVAFARDDSDEFRDNREGRDRAQLGSFRPIPNRGGATLNS